MDFLSFCVSLWLCSFYIILSSLAFVHHSADCHATTVVLMFSFSMKTCDYVRTKCETKVMLTLRQHHRYFPLSLLPLNVWITRLHFLLMNGDKMQLKKAGSHLGWYTNGLCRLHHIFSVLHNILYYCMGSITVCMNWRYLSWYLPNEMLWRKKL